MVGVGGRGRLGGVCRFVWVLCYRIMFCVVERKMVVDKIFWGMFRGVVGSNEFN